MAVPYVLLAALLSWPAATLAQPEDAVVAGELVVEPTTLIAAGFRWYIEGDANRNASVQLQYRRNGESAWREGMPLLRLNGEQMNNVYGAYTHVVANGFAGSLIDLQPDTDY